MRKRGICRRAVSVYLSVTFVYFVETSKYIYPPYVSMNGRGAYIGCCVFAVSGYRYLGDGGTDRREILHDGTYWSRTDLLPFWGRYLPGCQI